MAGGVAQQGDTHLPPPEVNGQPGQAFLLGGSGHISLYATHCPHRPRDCEVLKWPRKLAPGPTGHGKAPEGFMLAWERLTPDHCPAPILVLLIQNLSHGWQWSRSNGDP